MAWISHRFENFKPHSVIVYTVIVYTVIVYTVIVYTVIVYPVIVYTVIRLALYVWNQLVCLT